MLFMLLFFYSAGLSRRAMNVPDFFVILASNKPISDKDIECRKIISVVAFGATYHYALIGKNNRGKRKLRWLYSNRSSQGIEARWMVIDHLFCDVLAINRGPRRGTDGPEWADIAITQIAFEIYRTYSVSGGLPSLGKRR